MDLNIVINCHSSICIEKDVYIDPYNIIKPYKNAKVIFVTHSHYDHLDMPSIKNLFNSDTVIVGTQDSIDMLREEGYDDANLKVVKPYEKSVVYDVSFETFPSYNINKKFHPKENGWVGYNINIKDKVYTICGDTDATEELKTIKTDVLLIPVGGTYTMTAEEAAMITNTIKPAVVIPTHYGSIVGKMSDAETFSKLVDADIKVVKLIK